MSSPSLTIRNPKRLSATSPPRRPLQEKADLNDRNTAAPTIRVVADAGPDAYSKSPFPSEPAHFLPPRKSFRFHSGTTVSDENAHTIFSTAKATVDYGLYPPLLQTTHSFPGKRFSSGTTVSSDGETIANFRSSISPSLSSRFSQTTSTTPSTPTLSGLSFNDEDKLSTKLPALPEDHGRASTSTIRLVDSAKLLPLSEKFSDASLSSSASSGTVVSVRLRPRRSTGDLPSSPPNFEVLGQSSSPCGSSSSNLPTAFEPQSPTPNWIRTGNSIVSPSTDSIAFSDASYISVIPPLRARSASSPPSTSHASISTDNDVLTDLQYPQIRSASASRSWATSSESPEDASRMSEAGRLSLWSSRLSTIASESEPPSEIFSSALPSPRLRRDRRSIAEASDTTRGLSSPSDSSIPIPAPLFSGALPRPAVLSEGRDSDEGNDTLGELNTPQVRPKRSGYLAKLRSLSRPSSSESMKSQISFHGDLSWVRNFYRNGQFPSQHSLYQSSEHSASRLNTAVSTTTVTSAGVTSSPISEAFPAEIHRPRNRPRIRSIGRRNRSISRPPTGATNITTDEIVPERETNGLEPQPGTWTSRFARPIWGSSNWGTGVFSPRLHRDRRGSMAINTWSTPSFDEPFGKKPFSPVNRQILLFCTGFICPLLWFLAAFLSLPPQPATFDPLSSAEHGSVQPGTDARTAVAVIEYEERRYLKARWWRQLNRIMCVAGCAIIGAIIALVVIATRMH